MIRILGTTFAALLGLAFGSFLNVCLSRWPAGESVVKPGSHCRHCDHVLAWWENVPLVSWLALRGRCRQCGAWIGCRYPLVEAVVGVLWAISAWHSLPLELATAIPTSYLVYILAGGVTQMLLSWLLVCLAIFDFENLWLPDALTIPGIAFGLILNFCGAEYRWISGLRVFDTSVPPFTALLYSVIAVLAAAGLILLIRWLYWLVRRREGMGLGDAKLMALLAAWLGLPGALLAFGLGVVLGALAGVALLLIPAARRDNSPWAAQKLPLGTFLCIGGIINSLWGHQLITCYMRWAGL